SENEPNDLPDDAARHANSGTLTLGSMPMFKTWHICPNPATPLQPDIDALKFNISASQPGRLYFEVLYDVTRGDLDAAIFEETRDSFSRPVYTLVASDVSATNNACVPWSVNSG